MLGLASFVLGLVAVYLFTKDEEGTAASDSVEILIAKGDLEAGTPGSEIQAQQLYSIERVNRADVTIDNVLAPSQLSNTVLTLSFADGEPLRQSGLRSLGTVTQAVIPEGFEAVTITTDFVAGGASTIAPGNRVNLYVLLDPETGVAQVSPTGELVAAEPLPYETPRAELLLANVEVLDVQTGTPPLQVGSDPEATQGTNTGTPTSLIFVLAVDTLDAEKLIFASSEAELYVSRVRLDDEGNPPPPIESTPGQDFLTILSEEASAAFQRSNSTP